MKNFSQKKNENEEQDAGLKKQTEVLAMTYSSLDYLQKLGLSYYQAKVVMVLFRQNATAHDFTQLAGIPYTKIYQVLNSFPGRGIKINYSAARPRVYLKLSPNKVLNSLLNKKRYAVNQLLKQREKYVQQIQSAEIAVRVVTVTEQSGGADELQSKTQ